MKSSYLIRNVLDLLYEKGELGAKSCGSPMAQSLYLIREGELFGDLKRYRRLVGKLNYLTVTCPDIAHLIRVVSQYMFSPMVDHWVAIEQILYYLKGASGHGILFGNHGHNRIKCFTDVE